MSTIDAHASANGRGSDTWRRPWAHLKVERRSPGYCRITFEHAPVNAITATTVAELTELVELIEHDSDLNVVVFDSANPDHYLGHYDVDSDGERTAALPPWRDVLVRLSRAPVVSIASIRGRARGEGSEFVLACDLRFASRENTLLDDSDGPRAERCGYVNRLIGDDQLEDEVDRIATRLASYDHDAIARAKPYL